MKAFLTSLVLLAAISVAAAFGLQAIDRSAANVYKQPSSVRL